MASPQLTSTSLPEGFSIARTVMDDLLAKYLANGGPAVARAHLEAISGEIIKLYSDGKEAYDVAIARITAVENRLQQESEERGQQQLHSLMLSVIGTFKPAVPAPKVSSLACGELPPRLSTACAMQLWERLQQAGYIDDQYQPLGLSRTESAVLADELMARLASDNDKLMGIDDKWRSFEILWSRNNMRSDYYRALNQEKSSRFRACIRSLLDS